VLNSIRPGMLTQPNAMLLVASSPYARRGILWQAHRKHFGKDDPHTLVWRAPTRTMNPTVPVREIERAYDDDPISAAAEYGAEFRKDVEAFVAREAVDACVSPGVRERAPVSGINYFAFVDPSGGSADSMTLGVAHRDKDGTAVLDCVRERKPPFSPEKAVDEFAEVLKLYRVTKVVGDRYGGEFCREPFRKRGIQYEIAEKSRSDIYRETLALLNSQKIDLLDDQKLLAQICGLERRTARGGKDSIDHAPGAHDDLANAALGALLLCERKRNFDYRGFADDGETFADWPYLARYAMAQRGLRW
jgi:hypothetical protein